MKGNMKSFICGMLVMGVISCAGVYAADVWQNINVLPNTIKVVVDGKEVTMQVKAGDKVIYSKYAGNEVKLDGEEYIIVRQNDILAVVE